MIARKNLRWWIAIILAASAALNYFDRQALSILVDTIQNELGFNNTQYSYITATFLVGYTVMTGVAGRLLDWFGTRKVLVVAVLLWSIASVGHALCRNTGQLFLARFLLGTAQSANWPAGVKATAEWFPVKDRALAVGIFNSGSSIGAAISAPLITFIALKSGWRLAFLSTGVLGVLWVIAFLSLYRAGGGGVPVVGETSEARHVPTPSILTILKTRAAWGCFVARIFIDPVTYFFIFWVPKYLQADWKYGLVDIGRYLWAPYVALALGTVLGGWVPSQLCRKGWTVNRARKSTMLLSSLVILACCITLVGSSSVTYVVTVLGIFMFSHGFWGNIAIPAEVFHSESVGTVAGIGGLLGGFSGILAQIGIGWTVERHSFTPIIFCAGVSYLLAFLCLHVLIPQLGNERCEI